MLLLEIVKGTPNGGAIDPIPYGNRSVRWNPIPPNLWEEEVELVELILELQVTAPDKEEDPLDS